MFQILNSADKAYRYAVAIGDEIFNVMHQAVQDLITFPVGSRYINIFAGVLFIRMAAEKEVADWVAVGGSGDYVLITSSDLSTPTAAKWGADAVLTGLKEATILIPVPTSAWTKVNIKQVNDAIAHAFPDGIPGEVEGNVRQKDYAYADCTGDISDGKLSLDVLTVDGHSISVEVEFYNGTTLVGSKIIIVAGVEY